MRGDGLAPALLRVYFLALAVTLCGGATLTYLAERRNPAANISSLGDAFWWALVTVTTVGYGDRVPVTAAGRGIGLALIVCGIGLFSVFTATVAAYFVDRDTEDGFTEIGSNQAVIESNQEAIAKNQEHMEMSQRLVKDELEDVHHKLDMLLSHLSYGEGVPLPQKVRSEPVQSH